MSDQSSFSFFRPHSNSTSSQTLNPTARTMDDFETVIETRTPQDHLSSMSGENDESSSIPQTTTTRLITSLSKSFLNNEFSDICIHALSNDFFLHRVVLVSNPYFRQLLTGEWKEKTTAPSIASLTGTGSSTHTSATLTSTTTMDQTFCRQGVKRKSSSSSLLSYGYERAPMLLHERVKITRTLTGSIQEMTLHFDDPNITVESLTIVFGRLYGRMDYRIHAKNIFNILAAAVFFDDPDLCLACQEFAQSQILESPQVIVEYMEFLDEYYYGSYSDAIIKTCLQQLCQLGSLYQKGCSTSPSVEKQSSLPISQESIKHVYSRIPLLWLERLLISNWFFAPTEYDRYIFTRDILLERRSRLDHLKRKSSQETLSSLTPTLVQRDLKELEVQFGSMSSLKGRDEDDSKHGEMIIDEDTAMVPDLGHQSYNNPDNGELDAMRHSSIRTKQWDISFQTCPTNSVINTTSESFQMRTGQSSHETLAGEESETDTIYAKSPSPSNASPPSSTLELIELENTENATIQRIFSHGLLFSNMSFEELLSIKEDGLVPEGILERAIWNQKEFQHVISKTAPASSCLGLECLQNAIPKNDTDRIDDRNILKELTLNSSQNSCPDISEESSNENSQDDAEENMEFYPYRGLKHVPIRFSVEFKNLASIVGMPGTKIFSPPIVYAGSKWQIYIQEVMSEETPKLGLYLQRLPMETTSIQTSTLLNHNHHSTSSTATRNSLASTSMWDLLRSQQARVNQIIQDGGNSSNDATNPSTLPSPGPQASPPSSATNSSIAPATSRSLSTIPPPFIDPRRVTETWFQLHCFMGETCYKLESKPDVFKVYQSWGWRSLKLYRDAFLQNGGAVPTLRITVVMGHV